MASPTDRLITIVAALRDPETGCPWDLKQTHGTLAPYVLEEAHEVVDAIERGDMPDLRDELGDLLLQVVIHARLAEEAGAFTFGDVVAAVSAKMVRRHPHVFASSPGVAPRDDRPVPSAHDGGTWEAIKTAERSAKHRGQVATGLLAGVTVALPGLTRAVKLQAKASTVGFDWHDAGAILAKIEEEADEVAQALAAGDRDAVADEIGDLFFAVANLARHAGVDPEQAVRGTNAKFTRRFAHIERAVRAVGSSLEAATLEEMETFWNEAKEAGL